VEQEAVGYLQCGSAGGWGWGGQKGIAKFGTDGMNCLHQIRCLGAVVAALAATPLMRLPSCVWCRAPAATNEISKGGRLA
jgi:hypothetical protein